MEVIGKWNYYLRDSNPKRNTLRRECSTEKRVWKTQGLRSRVWEKSIVIQGVTDQV